MKYRYVFSCFLTVAALFSVAVSSGCQGCDQPTVARVETDLNIITQPRGGQNVNTLRVTYSASAFTYAKKTEDGKWYNDDPNAVGVFIAPPPDTTLTTWWENDGGAVYGKSSQTFHIAADDGVINKEFSSTISAPPGKYYDKTFKFVWVFSGGSARSGQSEAAVCVVK